MGESVTLTTQQMLYLLGKKTNKIQQLKKEIKILKDEKQRLEETIEKIYKVVNDNDVAKDKNNKIR